MKEKPPLFLYLNPFISCLLSAETESETDRSWWSFITAEQNKPSSLQPNTTCVWRGILNTGSPYRWPVTPGCWSQIHTCRSQLSHRPVPDLVQLSVTNWAVSTSPNQSSVWVFLYFCAFVIPICCDNLLLTNSIAKIGGCSNSVECGFTTKSGDPFHQICKLRFATWDSLLSLNLARFTN